MSEATNLCCVKCNSILDRATFQGLEVDLCPKCGGLWLDRGEITRAAKLPEAELARLRGLLTRREGPAPGPDREQGPLPRLPGQPRRGAAGHRPRRLLQQVPRHLPRPRRARRPPSRPCARSRATPRPHDDRHRDLDRRRLAPPLLDAACTAGQQSRDRTRGTSRAHRAACGYWIQPPPMTRSSPS